MKWHHSLYWRIAIGFVGCLALLLLVQAMLFVWVIARSGSTVPNQPPDRLAQTIAIDIGSALERDPALDVSKYLHEEYARDVQPFFVLLATGAIVDIGGPFDQAIVDESKARLALMRRIPPERLFRGRGFWQRPAGRPSGGDSLPFDARGARPRGIGPGPFRPVPIVASGKLAGAVVVPPQPPFVFLLRRYAPVLGIVAVVTLVVGTVMATIVIFGPARARLRQVEDAARRLGAGDLTARAPERGRDEVSAVATAFNAMATDLASRADALRLSDRLRRQLLADVSHELNTPMTAIRGYLETLSMPGMALDEDTRKRYLGIIADETGRLERIVGDLLDLARLEDGGGALRIDDVPVEALFDRIVARHERAAETAQVEFNVTIDPQSLHVRGDRDRLEQALQNLTANALRYAPARTAIELVARRVTDGVRFSVINHGPDIPTAHLPHLFDRFYRADGSRARENAGGPAGSGLGLSIVKAIVEQHRGTIGVGSAAGTTTFQFTIANEK